MEATIKQKRDGRLDCIKGIAISLVVLGNNLQFCNVGYSTTFVLNIIWSVQIHIIVIEIC